MLCSVKGAYIYFKKLNMDHYFVHTRMTSSGFFKVHKDGCMFMPKVTQRNYIGMYLTCNEALKDAKLVYSNVSACDHCLEEAYAELSLKAD